MVKARVLMLLAVALPLLAQQRFTPRVDSLAPPIFLNNAADDSIVNVIVEFSEEPYFLARQRSLSVPSADVYRARFAQFALDAGRSAPSILAARRQKEFYKVFFGVSTAVPRKAIAAIRRLAYVKNVQREKEVAATLERDLQQIRVPEARAAYGVDGNGVLVGIIDTGIDYLHPALGGGFGTGFKVVGGYDFVNDDPDPMDDNGHGTHVAGIIAADGAGLQGVAPRARILSYKSLDASGKGLEGDIIAAIERVADPNQDGDPADRPDVVNMSLGSRPGDPGDPLSTAVDNAVRLGITFVVSAGNSGGYTPVQGKEDNYYYTGMESVGSPGAARLAITVGVVDSTDALAIFSSKGPVRGTMEIKPDVLAPGVDVLSLAPGGGTAVMSGTSMSSPMVAGIAALLKSKRKGMTPAEVKSAIVNSSIDLGLSAMRQGGGRVDALRALGQRTAVEPAQLSFRLDDPAQSTWTQVETLLVVNSDGMAHDYSVAVAGNGAGYSVSTFPQAFSLAPGGTQSVLVTIGVNNLAVPIVNEDIRLYDGALLIMGTADTLRVPWAFARASRFLLAFSDTDPLFVGYTLGYAITPFNRVLDSKVRWIDPQHMEVIGAFDGTYNFAVYFPNAGKLVTREQIDFHGSGSIAFDASEATHTLRFDGRDENGQPFPPTADTRRTLRVDLPFEVPLFVALPAGSSTIMVSTSSTGIHFQPVESYIDLAGARRAVLPQYSSFQGISNDRILLPSAGTYTKQTVRFRVPPGTAQAKIYSEVITIQTIDSADYYNSIQVAIDTMDVGTGEASITLAEMKRIDTTFTTGIAFYVNAGDLSSDFLDYSTRYFTVPGDSLLVGLPSQQSLTSYRSPDGGTLTFGGGPVHIIDLSFNNGLANSIIFRLVFRGNLSEDRYTDVNHGTYAIFNEAGEELAEAPLDAPRAPFAVVPGKFRIEIESENFYVSNAKGTVSLVNSVDLTKAVPDAPTVMSFMVRDGQGRAGDRVLVGDHATLRFSANGFSFGQQLPVADSTRVFYRKHRSLEWITLPVSLLGSEPAGVGSVFQADLAPATAKDSSGIDLRIRLVDQTGNAADMVVSPAFQVGQWVDQGPSGVEADGDIPATYALAQNFPNPFNPSTTVRYDLPVASEVTLAVYDVLGREISKLVNEVRPAGRHVVVFDGTKFASGAYFYRLQARPAQEAGARPARSAGAGSFVETRRFVLLK